MLKFNAWPPTPGQVELTVPLDNLRARDTSTIDHYSRMGQLVGSLLAANMEESTTKLGEIDQIAQDITRSPNFVPQADIRYREDLTSVFMKGIGIEAMTVRQERGAHV